MQRRIIASLFLCICASHIGRAQEFKLGSRTVQVHGFFSQGFVKTDGNNWLTMNSNTGSGAMTDMGLNLSSQLSDKFRAGAQVYDRNLGQLGEWHPSMDWAVADYRFNNWLGVRAGKVKTPLGLYNDTQDLDFLHVFALLPQGVYPTDLRDTTIAHLGADAYGTVPLRHRLGDIAYIAYAGHRSDSKYSGYPYLLRQWRVFLSGLHGAQYGADLRWNTLAHHVTVGASRMNQNITAQGTFVNLLAPGAGPASFESTTKTYWTNIFYGEYAMRRLRVDSEYRRDAFVTPYLPSVNLRTDIHAWYVGGTYRVAKRVDLGSYYSHYQVLNGGSPVLAPIIGPTDLALPQNHIYDKVVASRVELNRFCYFKVEGHFMEGYGWATFPDGFYLEQNPKGFNRNTNALVLKTGFHF